MNLPDHSSALGHARTVVRELMRGREAQTRCWRLSVYDHSSRKLFKIPFANLDRTLDHLMPDLQSMVADLSDLVRSLREVVAAASVTMRGSRALVARSRGRPYLAAQSGKRTIRDA
jgi:hypothetical protein